MWQVKCCSWTFDDNSDTPVVTDLKAFLAKGWEPFAVTRIEGHYPLVWLRKKGD